MSGSTEKIRVAFLTVPECTGSTLYGMYDLFASVDRDWGLITKGQGCESPFQPVTVAAQAGSFQLANGVHILPDLTISEAGIPDIVCVPELLVVPDADISGCYPQETAWLKACYEGGSYLGAACSGALLIAETGLLAGEDATTHWGYCDTLARHHPDVRVHPHQALVTAGEGQRIVMVGGGSSWQDLALFLIARTVGLEKALQVAKIYLIDWHHFGQQPYAVLTCRAQVEDSSIVSCQTWLAQNYDHQHPVREMTRISGLSERSFKRRFQQATGMKPIEYVQTLRVEEAKQWLETGDSPVEVVAEAVGYEDASFFNRLFRRKVGLTPAQYRKRFGALKRVLSAQQQ